jgi:hypothetical protein
VTAISPYKTAELFGLAPPAHVSDKAADDKERLRAYDTYEALYDNQTELFESLMSISGDSTTFRRLISTARSIIEGTNRYLAGGLEWVGTPPPDQSGAQAAAGAGSEEVALTLGVLNPLLDREEFAAKFLSLKRWMLVRGDALLHITADDSKPEGRKISITELDPRTYFAIPDAADSEHVVGCYLVNIIKDDEDKEIAARLEYRKIQDDEQSAAANGTAIGQVFVKLSFYELAKWDDRFGEELAPVSPPQRFGGDRFVPLLEGVALDARITTVPVYHFRNGRRGNKIFGISELQGLETLILGVNQTTTDQELALAMAGLGVYWTDSGQPRDDEGNAVPWEISPASMLRVDDGKQVQRVQGVLTVQPGISHADFLKGNAQETSGTPKIALGGIDASNPASGVALSIQMAPMVAKNEEKEEEIIAKLVQMMFDLLTGWLPVHEGYTDNGVRIVPAFDDPIPVNREAVINELNILVTAKIISAAYARTVLASKLGYVFTTDVGAEVAGEQQAAADIAGARLDAEVAAAGGAAPTA